jgi:copper chaperone
MAHSVIIKNYRRTERVDEERDSKKEKERHMTSILKVQGMSCQHCVMSVTKALNQLDGIENVQIDLAKGEVRFDNTNSIASDQIQKAITDAGYEVVQG